MSTRQKFRWLAVTVAVAASVAPIKAQETVPLLGLTNTVWKYLQAECLDGTNWTQAGYDDGAWPSGPALLAFENNPAIVPFVHTILQPPSLLDGRAAYFRTRFNWPNPTMTVTLEFSNRVDDCAVIYLNGNLLTNAGVSGSSITCTNFGRSAITGEAIAPEVFRIAGTLLAGDNVLAVEVHQVSAGSDDVVWGCALGVVLPRMSIRRAGSAVDLCWTSEPGIAYRVEYRPSLGTGAWITLRDGITSTEATACISESLPATASGFYRIAISKSPNLAGQPQNRN